MHRDPRGFLGVRGPGPFLSHVGPLYERDGVFALRVQEWHLNSDESAHGGLLASLADFSVGRAVRAEAGSHAVTVSLTCDYLGPAALGDWVEARTRVERLGGALAFSDCSLVVDEREVVRARAVFAVVGD